MAKDEEKNGGYGMKCPYCLNEDTKVIDSRATEEGQVIRRRRECENCKKRFTTYEKIEEIPLIVIKKDKSREVFDRSKVMNSILKACDKRKVPMMEIETIVTDIERGLNNMMEKEIESSMIGEFIMDHLKNLDEVAYVRFASVYKKFQDVKTFISEIEKLLSEEGKDRKDGEQAE